jgi:hypothetical protein
MKKLLLLSCILLSVVLHQTPAQNSALASDIRVLADNGRSFEERKAAILKRWNELRPVFAGDVFYDAPPSVSAPYSAGKLKSAFLRDALNMLNFYRFLTGLPDDVGLKEEYNELCQHGSVLNTAYKAIAHRQSKPSDMSADFYTKASKGIGSSNLGQGHKDLHNSVEGWMEDSDSGNVDRLGHRRWVLNPPMRYTGFGFVNGFSSVYTFDTARTEKTDYQAVCFPGGAAFPSDFFKPNYAWSVSLNPGLYQRPNRSSITVTLTETSSGKTWKFPGNNAGYFNIDTQGFGIPICIIFLPQGISKYEGTYRVEIEGLKNTAGDRVRFGYETTFFPFEVPAGPGDFKTVANGTGTITITGYIGQMQNLIIPEKINGSTVTVIGKGSFSFAKVSKITFPGSLKIIEESSLWYSKITAITLPEGLTSIGDQAFSFCTDLVSVSFPNSLTKIGNFAFMDCSSLTTVTIPPGIKEAGFGAFRGCNNLTPAVRSALTARFGGRIFQ